MENTQISAEVFEWIQKAKTLLEDVRHAIPETDDWVEDIDELLASVPKKEKLSNEKVAQ